MKKVAAILIALMAVSIAASALEVYDIVALPNPLVSYTYFTAQELPSGYLLDIIEVTIYDASSAFVARRVEEDVYRVYWDGTYDDVTLANGVYYYYVFFYNYDINNDEVDTDTFGPHQLVINR